MARKVGVVIPARDEQGCIALVVRRCFAGASEFHCVRVVVADNNSRDQTAAAAREAGAEVISVLKRGYGEACLAAVRHLGDWPDLLVFIDGDGSSRPEEISRLLEPIQSGRADMVIGERPEHSPLTLLQRWGNTLATCIIALRWGRTFHDIGPFRALRRASYDRLGMTNRTWGWTVEMQILALLRGLRVEEVLVSCEARLAGKSKISGSIVGAARAATQILWTLLRYTLLPVSAPDTRRAEPSGSN